MNNELGALLAGVIIGVSISCGVFLLLGVFLL